MEDASQATSPRQELALRIVDAAERRIVEGGLAGLRARDLASDAGCALGAIYTAHDDLRAVVLAVNRRTLKRLGAHVEAARQAVAGDDPVGLMVAMSRGYRAFAEQNYNAWRALFDIELRDDDGVPVWYRDDLEAMFAVITKEVARLAPGLSPQDQHLAARTLFAAVHGIVSLGLERRVSSVPMDQMDRMIEMVITGMRLE